MGQYFHKTKKKKKKGGGVERETFFNSSKIPLNHVTQTTTKPAGFLEPMGYTHLKKTTPNYEHEDHLMSLTATSENDGISQ